MTQSHVQEPPIDLVDFERAVYSQDFERATKLLIQALSGFEKKTWDLVTVSDTGIAKNRQKNSAKRLLSRFCAAVTALLCSKNMNLSRTGFEFLILYKRYLVTIFAATNFANMNHFLDFIGDRKEDSRVSYSSDSDIFKVILSCTADSNKELVNNLLGQLNADLSFILWLSLLDNEMVLTEEADHTRNNSLCYSQRYQGVIPGDTTIFRVVNTWMFLSYINCPDKHKIKNPLNNIIKNFCQKRGAKQPFISSNRGLVKKPKILVACERFTSDHAMFRCYGRAIASLRECFTLVFIGAEQRFDKNSLAIFDESIILPRQSSIKDIKSIIGKVIVAAPDIIYFPSLGMESWAVGLAQYRLAPIQMMTMGHPATSYCDNMDYLFAEQSTLGDANCVNETVLHVKDGTFALSMGSLDKNFTADIRQQPEIVKIAVPSIAYKLNPSVLSACKLIQELSKNTIEFHFFPNMSGVNHLAMQLRMQEILPCIVHENKHYNDYMNLLGQCDIALSPFPFGNTNGFIDSARLALPVVCLDGPEAHSHTDFAFSERIKLPEFCRATTLEEYIQAAVKLVDNHSLRVSISNAIQALDIDQLFFKENDIEACQDMTKLFNWVYHNHESIQSKGQHLWTVEERINFTLLSATHKNLAAEG